jgi:hypothetical protein
VHGHKKANRDAGFTTGNQGQSPIRASILAGDVKARHDKMVELVETMRASYNVVSKDSYIVMSAGSYIVESFRR